MEIIPTVVPASLAAVETTAQWASLLTNTLHVDIADGTFAPNSTWMPEATEHFTPRGGFLYEAHLMVALPREVGLRCIKAGATRVIGHVESMGTDAANILAQWKAAGAAEVGLGILFGTPLETLDPFVKECDVVQMMTIASIGVQGLPFEPSAPARVAELHARHPELLISVDGGVSEATIESLARAGARRFCAGSVLSKAANSASTYGKLMELAENAIH